MFGCTLSECQFCGDRGCEVHIDRRSGAVDLRCGSSSGVSALSLRTCRCESRDPGTSRWWRSLQRRLPGLLQRTQLPVWTWLVRPSPWSQRWLQLRRRDADGVRSLPIPSGSATAASSSGTCWPDRERLARRTAVHRSAATLHLPAISIRSSEPDAGLCGSRSAASAQPGTGGSTDCRIRQLSSSPSRTEFALSGRILVAHDHACGFRR